MTGQTSDGHSESLPCIDENYTTLMQARDNEKEGKKKGGRGVGREEGGRRMKKKWGQKKKTKNEVKK